MSEHRGLEFVNGNGSATTRIWNTVGSNAAFWNVLASLQWPKPTVQLTRPHLSRGEDVLVDDAIGDKDPRSEMKTAIQQYGLWNRFCQDMEESNVEKIWQESNHMKK